MELFAENGDLLFKNDVEPQCGFYIKYTHSVALSPVEDYFLLKNGKISLKKTVYHDFGAGLPHEPGEGQKMKVEGGKVTITGYQRMFPEFTLRVGRIADHHLVFLKSDGKGNCLKKNDLRLLDLAPGGAAILLRPDSSEKSGKENES